MGYFVVTDFENRMHHIVEVNKKETTICGLDYKSMIHEDSNRPHGFIIDFIKDSHGIVCDKCEHILKNQ